MKIFDTLQKFPKTCVQFGQNNYCHRLSKVAQSAINRQSGHTVSDGPPSTPLKSPLTSFVHE